MAGQSPASFPHVGLILGTSQYVLAANQGTYSLSGQAANLAYAGSSVQSPGPFPHLGLLGGLGQSARVMPADFGSYSISGQAAGGLKASRLPADFGTYVLAGQVAALTPSLARAGDPAPLPHLGLLLAPATTSRTLIADAGVYTITGSDGLVDLQVTADVGTFTLVGQDAGLLRKLICTADFGTYTVAGQNANFSIAGSSRVMPADFGSYFVSGTAAGLVGTYRMPADQGFYAQLGQSANFSIGFRSLSLTAETGAYSVSGLSVVLDYFPGRRVIADTGYYLITGGPVTGLGSFYETGAVVYLPLRVLSGVWTTTGIQADEQSLKAWLPPARQPIAYQQNNQWLCDPTWYRFFQYVAEIKLGGANGPTITEVADNAAATAQNAATTQTQISAVIQQGQTNAESLQAAIQVVQNSSLPGSDQIPPPQLSPYEVLP